MRKHSFVIVSNRLPVSVGRQDGELVFELSSGGLATAMSSLKEPDTIWVGWCGTHSDNLTSKEKRQIREEFMRRGCYPVFLTKRQIEAYYDGYSNDTLWALFHYFQSIARYDNDNWQIYEEVNQLFAAAVRHCAQTTAKVWVQDYQLLLLPQLVRDSLSRTTIGFFLHIPFPSFEIYRLLPERTQLLRGMMGADIIGFHIHDYARHFLSSCERLLGVHHFDGQIMYEDRIVSVGMYPISVDYDKFARTAKSGAVQRTGARLRRRYKGQKMVLSIDRLDYSKGIPERLEAYQRFLAAHPEYHGRVVLQMIAVPSRTTVESYRLLRDQIEQTVGHINGIFGTADWMPISYQFQNRPFDEIVASYKTADVMLVTPLRDGMNLVAKEYVASKQRSPGVLILSELAGASDEMTEALLINPNNPAAIADTLYQALEMPLPEQRRRLRVMQQRLQEYDLQVWAKNFMDSMALAAVGGNRPTDSQLSEARAAKLKQHYRTSQRKLIILDYDGTIKPFTASPSMLAGFPSLKLRRLLARLAQDPSVHVAIISGRPKRMLQTWCRGLRLDIGAEHGAWTRLGGKWAHQENIFKGAKPPILHLMREYAERTSGAEVEEKEYALVWHYRNVTPELAYTRAGNLYQDIIRSIDRETIEVRMGDKIVEVKQRSVHKGNVVRELMQHYNPDFVLCAGDDYTDEDMFAALDNTAYTLKVGTGETAARFSIASPEELLELLSQLPGKQTITKRLPRIHLRRK